jgi:hypothetical protein
MNRSYGRLRRRSGVAWDGRGEIFGLIYVLAVLGPWHLIEPVYSDFPARLKVKTSLNPVTLKSLSGGNPCPPLYTNFQVATLHHTKITFSAKPVKL